MNFCALFRSKRFTTNDLLAECDVSVLKAIHRGKEIKTVKYLKSKNLLHKLFPEYEENAQIDEENDEESEEESEKDLLNNENSDLLDGEGNRMEMEVDERAEIDLENPRALPREKQKRKVGKNIEINLNEMPVIHDISEEYENEQEEQINQSKQPNEDEERAENPHKAVNQAEIGNTGGENEDLLDFVNEEERRRGAVRSQESQTQRNRKREREEARASQRKKANEPPNKKSKTSLGLLAWESESESESEQPNQASQFNEYDKYEQSQNNRTQTQNRPERVLNPLNSRENDAANNENSSGDDRRARKENHNANRPKPRPRKSTGLPEVRENQRGIRRRNRYWTEEETNNLIEGVRLFGAGSWAEIAQHFAFVDRTTVDLKDKYRNLRKIKTEEELLGRSG